MSCCGDLSAFLYDLFHFLCSINDSYKNQKKKPIIGIKLYFKLNCLRTLVFRLVNLSFNNAIPILTLSQRNHKATLSLGGQGEMVHKIIVNNLKFLICLINITAAL